ncbi:TRM13/UPF0224 family, U11-48K-like CHHC zinc finger domain [Cinara cedri]|uniref:TRM13/UPF0224 family, U11-48K-like CHHC zinc finger domain n=1 Tax=Cinara cedri TaxID=506608 RepID=A0A5E4N9L2_9HEMI|nr:TRM13/UPF0224 family, U11-48K-like CHHC zinc finger domain [Cinara cedri]
MELLHLAPDTFDYHCPYNPAHTMPQKTLIKHLIRCPDKPPNFRNCTYNISHVMHESELADHEENCPNRILFDTILYESEDMKRPVPVIDHIPAMDYSKEESWEGMEQSSDVLKDISKATVSMKAIHGSTRSERKKYRNLLHISHNNTNNKSGADNSITGNNRAGNSGTSDTNSVYTENKDQNLQQRNKPKELFIGKRPTVARHINTTNNHN